MQDLHERQLYSPTVCMRSEYALKNVIRRANEHGSTAVKKLMTVHVHGKCMANNISVQCQYNVICKASMS